MNTFNFLARVLIIGSILFGNKSYASSINSINIMGSSFSFYDDNRIEIQNDEGDIIIGGDRFNNTYMECYNKSINIKTIGTLNINEIRIPENYSFFDKPYNFTINAKDINFSNIKKGNNFIHIYKNNETDTKNPDLKNEINIEATNSLLFNNIVTNLDVFHINCNKARIKGRRLTIEGGSKTINNNYFYTEGTLEIDISEKTEILGLNVREIFISTCLGGDIDKLIFGNLNFINNNVGMFYATKNSAELNREENKTVIANNNFISNIFNFLSINKDEYNNEFILINGSYNIIDNNIKMPYRSIFTFVNRSNITINTGNNGYFNIDKNGDVTSFLMLVESNVLRNKAGIVNLDLVGNNSIFKFGGKGIAFRKIVIDENIYNNEEEETLEQVEQLILVPTVDDVNLKGDFRINVEENVIIDIPTDSVIETHEINFKEGSKLIFHVGDSIEKNGFIKFAGGRINGGSITGEAKIGIVFDDNTPNESIAEMGFQIIDDNFNIENAEFIPEINENQKIIKSLKLDKDSRILKIKFNY